MNEDVNFKNIALANRARLAEIWRQAREDVDQLRGEERVLADQMLAHNEFRKVWDTIETVGDHMFDPKKEANPFLHISMHVALENQIASNDPPETRETFERLVEGGMDPHEAKHAILRVLIHEIWNILSQHERFNRERFCKELAKL
jgi:hypothetical protein